MASEGELGEERPQPPEERESKEKRRSTEEDGGERAAKKPKETQRGGTVRKDEVRDEPEGKRRRAYTNMEDIMISQLRKMEEELKKDTPDVAEMFSPPRVSEMGKGLGLVAGEAMDLMTGWEFSLGADRQKA